MKSRARRTFGAHGYTTNFLEEPWATTIVVGNPSFPLDQHVVERFTRMDAETLLYQFTVESGNYEVPYSGEYTWPATTLERASAGE